MRLGLFAAGLLTAACASLDKPGLEAYDDIRAAIAVKADAATGMTTASSEPAAKEEVFRPPIMDSMDASGLSGGALTGERARSKFYVLGEKAADGSVKVYLVSAGQTPVLETEAQKKPWTETNPDAHDYVGDPWRKVYWELIDYRHECSGRMCTRFKTDRMKLTADDVRAMLAEGRDEIRVSFSERRIVDTRLDIDQLAAVLDALGAANQFR